MRIVREEMDAAGAVEMVDAVRPAGRAVAGVGALAGVRQGAAAHQGPPRARVLLRAPPPRRWSPTRCAAASPRTASSRSTSTRSTPSSATRSGPRFGLMRGREFLMKDAYSFHTSAESLDETYRAMERAYRRIFDRCGLEYTAVEADTGNIGGSESHEFMVLADTGEDAVAACACGYGANVEKASTGRLAPPPAWPVALPLAARARAHPGPERRGRRRGVPRSSTPRTSSRRWSSRPTRSSSWRCVRGDDEVNEIKLKNALGCAHLQLASEAKVEQVTGGADGLLRPGRPARACASSPTPRSWRCRLAATGANRGDYHLVGVVPGRDFSADLVTDHPHRRASATRARAAARRSTSSAASRWGTSSSSAPSTPPPCSATSWTPRAASTR